MLYDIDITGEQVAALAGWAALGGESIANVQIRVDETGYLHAAQGDERATFGEGGEIVADDEPEPFEGGDGTEPGPAGGTEDDETTLAERIARHARELIDPDYDPAATDDDGVPLFSEETRAAETPSRFKLGITFGNDAMQTPLDVALALKAVTEDIVVGRPAYDVWQGGRGNIRDANGNTVGSWEVTA